jgi:pimeloyl-ACP methyl ester carboxylesterase
MWEMAGYTDVIGGCRQILLDHRGHGRSGRPSDVERHQLDEYVADVIAVLDAAHVEQAVLVGYSAGAVIAYATAAAHPDRCSGIVGIGGLGPPDEQVMGQSPRLVRELREQGTRWVMEEMASSENEPCPQWLVDNLSETDAEMFVLQLEGWASAPTEWAVFPKITAPTFIVCGEHEDAGEASLAASRLADGTAVVLPGYGHLQAFWHGEVTAPLIRDFLVSHHLLP